MAQPPAPPPVLNGANAVDSMNQQIYVSMSKDPVFGPLVKAIPPPPKVSALFNGNAIRELTNTANAAVRQVAPQYPITVPQEATRRPTSEPGQNQTAIVL